MYHRHSIRLPGYDYSRPGKYFVTICTQNAEYLFGEIVGGEMRLNNVGKMIQTVWNEIPEHYKYIEIDAFQIMPNHIHGIIFIVGAGPRACPIILNTRSDTNGKCSDIGQPQGVAPTGLSLSDIVHRFKTMTTKRYADGVKINNWQPFGGRLWQRNFYEHVIRNEKSLELIREYIIKNPYNWKQDELFL